MAKLTTYQVSEIAKNTWVINEAGMTAMFLLKGNKRALLIDTGVGMTDLKKLISWLTPLPYDVVLTHGHQDHIGGAAQFEEVYIHEKDAANLRPIDYDSIAEYVELLKNCGSGDVYNCSCADIRRIEKMPKLLPLKEGMVFELGNRSIEVIETPGHTPGGCCFLDRKERILFSGDACNGYLLCQDSINTLLGALVKIKSYESEFDRNFNGHVGYAGMPFVGSMDHSITNAAIRLCEEILSGTAKSEEKNKGNFAGDCKVATDGRIRIIYSPDRLIDEGETPMKQGSRP